MWKDVSINYEINEEGQVRNKKTLKILKPYLSGKYLSIRFEFNGKKQIIHQLVGSVFLPSPTDENCVIDHINRNKHDNRACNLRWVSRSVNSANRPVEIIKRKNGKNEHHHIYKDKSGYICKIFINKKLYYKHSTKLNELIIFRDEIINNAVSYS